MTYKQTPGISWRVDTDLDFWVVGASFDWKEFTLYFGPFALTVHWSW